jgi:phospholipase C
LSALSGSGRTGRRHRFARVSSADRRDSRSALDGPPKLVRDGALTPDFYSVNTMQPPYQPSAVKPVNDGNPLYADPASGSILPPQGEGTIGDLLSAKGIGWAWYAGAWLATLEGLKVTPPPIFQYHHQPFNYFAAWAPGTDTRAEPLRDGGLNGDAFIMAIDAGTLPPVAFYKPQGNLNEHPAYTDVLLGDRPSSSSSTTSRKARSGTTCWW